MRALFLVVLFCVFVVASGEGMSDWSTEYDPSLDTTECDFKVIDANRVSRSEFESLYMNKEPVIILNLEDNQAFRDFTKKTNFMNFFREEINPTVPVPPDDLQIYDEESQWAEAEKQNQDICIVDFNKNNSAVLLLSYVHVPLTKKKIRLSMKDYLERRVFAPQRVDARMSDTFYMFGEQQQWGHKWDQLLEIFHWPEKYLHLPPGYGRKRLHLGMGGTGSGVPFHHHEEVFAQVFHGKKRWFALRPNVTEPEFIPKWFNVSQSSLSWTVNVYPNLSPEEKKEIQTCTLSPGMVFYIPTGYWHSTLNLGESMFGTVYNV